MENSGKINEKCAFCKKPAAHRCAGCHNVFYCSREHQKSHWKIHKNVCKPVKICEDSTLGRHLIAVRDIKQGEIILREKPLVRGPSQVTPPVCLGCLKSLLPDSGLTPRPCSKCGWPVCSINCEASPDHIPECEYTQQRGFKVEIKHFVSPHPSYQGLMLLRCLYLRDHHPEKWAQLTSFESHDEQRKETSQYDQDKITTQFIIKFFKLESKFTEDEIMKIAGIIQVNAHEIPLTDPHHVAIYNTATMLEHNCRAKCYRSFSSRGELLVSSGVTITANTHLSICYTDPLWGTSNRRHFLQQTKFFSCTCDRCSDPTEYGIMFNAVKCQNKNCDGYLLPKSFLDEKSQFLNSNNNGINKEHGISTWFCNKCNQTCPYETIQNVLEHIGTDMQAMRKGDIANCELFLEHYGKILHPNHFYLIDVKIALAQLIGNIPGNGLANISDEQLHLKARLCRQMCDLLEKLIPAEKRAKGSLLFELHAAIAEIGRRKAAKGEIGPEALEAMILESRKILSDSVELLRNEPENLPEGKICLQAKQNIVEMDILLKSIHAKIGDSP